MPVSIDYLKFIENTEGYSATPYWDVSDYAIGYGHNFVRKYATKNSTPPISYITEDDAEKLMLSDLEPSEKMLDNSGLVLDQNQYNNLAYFGFGAGIGKLKKLLKFINSSDLDGFQNYILSNGTHDLDGNIIQSNYELRQKQLDAIDPSSLIGQHADLPIFEDGVPIWLYVCGIIIVSYFVFKKEINGTIRRVYIKYIR